ncbi:hypothetical protein LUZ60_007171 [Juncus effusus]|nr:hypothetical protein LUZ60_007171 [Juncus effusus]
MEGKSSCDVEYLKATELKLALPGSDIQETETLVSKSNKRSITDSNERSTKAQVVGWPPVRAQRMNSFRSKRNEVITEEKNGVFVKVSMDRARFLRKIDLKVIHGYKELRVALEAMFKCSSSGGNEYAIAYEDKDGDLMLVGDVPWEMFVCSCNKLRIMKGSEARGLSSNAH